MTNYDDELVGVFLDNESSLKRYLKKVSGSHNDADDMYQEAWIRLSRNRQAAAATPVPYLVRIVRNLGIDYSRAKRTKLTREDIAASLSIPDDRPDPYRQLEDRNQLSRLMDIIEDLPERQRGLLLAARLEQRSHAALAKEFDISVRTVELEIRRALDYCTDRLAKINRT
ncbi:sigma-70 family RNA polymerase sigma factor [Neorhizobium sp. NCHU2750]|uniref:RNA polymerase sigma factor n=1 Tax=Neorhizobium sp. NCHU2750 TaxID=1825976 RepID=UPI000E711BE0|nr:RNA polymerase sigma factor [Neorhizobium sp. NCHU2750]